MIHHFKSDCSYDCIYNYHLLQEIDVIAELSLFKKKDNMVINAKR